MDMEKTLCTFWICTDMESTGDDKMVCEPFCYRETLCNAHTFISGLHIEYEWDEPGCPATLVFDRWDVAEDELVPDYYQTGPIIALESIRNGFRAVTGNDEGKTTYTFKKTQINPFHAFLERHPNWEANKQQEAERRELENLRKTIVVTKSVEC